jgi:hypothetical protein
MLLDKYIKEDDWGVAKEIKDTGKVNNPKTIKSKNLQKITLAPEELIIR